MGHMVVLHAYWIWVEHKSGLPEWYMTWSAVYCLEKTQRLCFLRLACCLPATYSCLIALLPKTPLVRSDTICSGMIMVVRSEVHGGSVSHGAGLDECCSSSCYRCILLTYGVKTQRSLQANIFDWQCHSVITTSSRSRQSKLWAPPST